MKKQYSISAIAVLSTALLAGAVTWTGNSNPINWAAATSINASLMKAPQIVLRCEVIKGFVTIRYGLPQAAKNAKLNIYNAKGVPVKNFDLQSGNNAIHWNYAAAKVAAGVYVASLRYGDTEKNVHLSLTGY